MSERPPHAEQREEVAVGKWKELEEEGTVDRKIASDTTTQRSIQRTGLDPSIRAANGRAKDSSDEESRIESWPTTDDVGDGAPEGSTETETQKERKSGEADRRFTDAVLGGEGGKGQGDALEPEVL